MYFNCTSIIQPVLCDQHSKKASMRAAFSIKLGYNVYMYTYSGYIAFITNLIEEVRCLYSNLPEIFYSTVLQGRPLFVGKLLTNILLFVIVSTSSKSHATRYFYFVPRARKNDHLLHCATKVSWLLKWTGNFSETYRLLSALNVISAFEAVKQFRGSPGWPWSMMPIKLTYMHIILDPWTMATNV